MSVVDLVTIRLNWGETNTIRPTPHLLRGAVAQLFSANSLFHQHEGQQVVYRYPQVQYRWDRHGPMIVGLGEGARFLASVEWAGLTLRIGEQYLTVRDAVCHFRRHIIESSPRLLRYHFISPWLPLSQENYQRYRNQSKPEQAAELDRLAVAGVLIGLRGFGVDFPSRLYAAFERHDAYPCHYKGIKMCGFRGSLLANVNLPDGFAIGRAVSHGYGWLSPDSPPSSKRGADDDRSENGFADDC
jgi:hypothetical protein